MATKKLEVLITGNAKAAQKAFGDLESSAGKSGKKTESALSGVAGRIADIGVAAAAFGAFAAFDESQRVAKQTEAVIASTGGAANVTADSVADLASELSKKAGVDDEAIQSGQNLLLTFTKVRNEVGKGNDVFDQATKLALDMSVAMGTDMKTASMQVGKALNDPIKGMTSLSRAGIQFTAQQKEQVKALVQSGDTLGAQKIILKELETQFGGSAEAQATSLGKAKVAVGNLAESIGGVLAPAMEKGADLASSAADAFSGLSTGVQQAAVAGAGLAYAGARWGPALLDAASSAKTAGGNILAFGQLTAEAIRTRPEGVGRLAAAFDVLGAAAPKTTAKVSGLVESMGGLAIAAPVAGSALVVAGLALADWIAQSQAAKENTDDLRRAFEAGVDPIDAVNEKLARTLAGAEDGFKRVNGDKLRMNMEATSTSIEELSAVLQMSDKDFDNWDRAMRRSGGQGVLLANDVNEMRGAYVDAHAEQKVLETSMKMLGVETEDTTAAMEEQTGTTRSMTDSIERMIKPLQRAADEFNRATDAAKEFYDEQARGLSVQIDAEASLDDYAQSLKDNGRETDINTEKGRANQQALIDVAQAAAEAATETWKQTGSTKAAADQMRGYAMRLADTMRQAGYTDDEIKVMLTRMGMTPDQITTTFKTNAPETTGKVGGLLSKIQGIPTSKTTTVTANTGQASSALDTLQSKINRMRLTIMEIKLGGARAEGGPVNAGEPYLVGERGPEIMVPGKSGTVLTASQTKQIMSNSGGGTALASGGGGSSVVVNVTVEGTVIAERGVALAVREALIDYGRRTGKPIFAGLA